MKICTKCKIEKDYTEFHKHKSRYDGFNNVCKKCRTNSGVLYYQENKKKIKAYRKVYTKNNKKLVAKQVAKYYQEHKEERKVYQTVWLEKNRKKVRARAKKRQDERLKNDPSFKLIRLLRDRVTKAIKKSYTKKASSTRELLGSSVAYVRKHLESQFVDGMSWDNHGEWHIDHIRPCASFDLSDPEQQKECFNYKNLQPLWAKDNLSKGDRF